MCYALGQHNQWGLHTIDTNGLKPARTPSCHGLYPMCESITLK